MRVRSNPNRRHDHYESHVGPPTPTKSDPMRPTSLSADTAHASSISTIAFQRSFSSFILLLFDSSEQVTLCRTTALLLNSISRQVAVKTVVSNGVSGLHCCVHIRRSLVTQSRGVCDQHWAHWATWRSRPQLSGKKSLMSRGLQEQEEAWRVTSHYVFREATKLIWEHGALDLTMERIAGRSNLGRATLYYRFGSRSRLILFARHSIVVELLRHANCAISEGPMVRLYDK
jgi:hypothetical protein